jgi:transposase
MWSIIMCLYVRNIRMPEGRRLQGFIRRGTNRIKMRRAQVILASDQGFRVPAIAVQYHFSEDHVRHIIKSFNAEGFSALEPKYGIGRPAKFTPEQRSVIVETALCPPDLLGEPYKRWSLPKLRDFLIREKVVESISIETIRQILKANKVKLRRTKTWKECNDPKLRSKKK